MKGIVKWVLGMNQSGQALFLCLQTECLYNTWVIWETGRLISIYHSLSWFMVSWMPLPKAWNEIQRWMGAELYGSQLLWMLSNILCRRVSLSDRLECCKKLCKCDVATAQHGIDLYQTHNCFLLDKVSVWEILTQTTTIKRKLNWKCPN